MKTLIFITKYIRYFLKSKSIHSAQSPFLYEFITNILHKKLEDEKCKKIETLRKELCKSEDIIKITDFGAGSHINCSSTRRVKDIAKNSAKNSKFGQVLYRIIKHYKPKNIIELGTSLGISTLYLALAEEKSNIYTFEGCPETSQIARENFDKMQIKNTNIILGDFKLTLRKELEKINALDFCFVDGNHQKNATITYFELCLKYSNNNTIFVFDDIHWSDGMEEAWDYITSHHKTTLTIDLFYVGIVFVKSELSKENYIIRF
jgi:predicted O-methyltransferase YrrM